MCIAGPAVEEIQPTPTIQSNESTGEILPSPPAHLIDSNQQVQTNETSQQTPLPLINPLKTTSVPSESHIPSAPPLDGPLPVASQISAEFPVKVPETSILEPFKLIQPIKEIGENRFMPGCFVHKTAKLGTNVYVGIFGYIGAEAIVGSNVTILEEAIVPPKATIPNNTVLIQDPLTAELVDLLQDLETVKVNFKKEMQPKVDAILKSKK